MTSTISRDVRRNMKYKIYQHGSLHTPGTIGWYVEDLNRCLHPDYKSFDDVKNAIAGTDRIVDGVYNRAETGQTKKRKIGTGKAKFKKTKNLVSVSRDAKTNSNEVLNTDDFIPCVDHTAALVLEAALQRALGKRDRVIGAVKDKVQIIVHRWEPPATANDGEKGGYEVFNFEDIWDDSVSVVRDLLRTLTSTKSVGRSSPRNRYYQADAKSLLADFCINGGSQRDFYLLMKPRSGKNITCILGLVDFAKEYFNRTGRPLRVLLLSLWPSAFAGLGNDVRDYRFDVDVGFVNTQNNSNWEQELAHAESVNQLVFVTASLQSLDANLAKELKNNPNLLDQLELEAEDYDAGKHEKLRTIGFPVAVFDECDHGLRTENSQAIIDSFGFNKCIWMSGSDLYALRNEAVPGVNAFVYDFIQEIQDVVSGKIERRPLPVFLTFEPGELPFEDSITVEDMNVEGLSRRMRNIQQTTVDIKCEKAIDKRTASKLRCYSWIVKDGKKLAVDGEGEVIRAKNNKECRAMLETVLTYGDSVGSNDYVSPNDLIAEDRPANIFAMTCSVAGQLALYNELILMNSDWVPVSTKEFAGATNLERDVNDRINELNNKGLKTVTFTTRQLLRGAKANWDGVIRLDDLSDYKIGLQAALRGQNTSNHKFYVWDLNLFRCAKMNVEISRAGTKGTDLNSAVRKNSDLIPVFAKGTGFKAVKIAHDRLIEIWQQADGISEGLAQDYNYDNIGLLTYGSILENVGKNRSEQSERDERAGKVNKKEEPSTNKPIPLTDLTQKEIRELRLRAKTVGRQLSVLLYLMINQNQVYDEIAPLLNNCPNDLFEDWLEHVGIYTELSHKDIKKQLVGLFVQERINHQLQMLRKRFESGNFSPRNWNELTQLEKSDVFTEEEKIKSMYTRYGGHEFWSTHPPVFDPGCGRGEFLVVWADMLREHGCKDLSNKIYWADLSPINVRLVAARLNIDSSNGFVYNAGSDGLTEESFNEGLQNMAFDINKTHVVGNLPFTSGQGKAPVAIPILLNILRRGTPLTINLVQHTGFMPSNDYSVFRNALYDAGLKQITMNPVDLFKESKAKVRTADLYCERNYKGSISIDSLKGNTYDFDYRTHGLIIDGGSKELTEFLYSLLDKVKHYGCLLNRNTKSAKGSNPKADDCDKQSVDTPRPGYEPYLSKSTVKGKIIRYAPADLFKWSKDLDCFRSVHGYRPSGLEYGDMRVGLTTIIEPGVHLPSHPNLYFLGTQDEDHAKNLDRYIHSGPIERFVLPMTRENKTFDAKTADGVTKFIPMLPAGIKIDNDNDVFDFLNTPEHIREAVRANYKY